MKTGIAFLFVLGILVRTLSFASDTVDCASTCPSGESMVGFADGNNASCSCIESAPMQETVVDESYREE